MLFFGFCFPFSMSSFYFVVLFNLTIFSFWFDKFYWRFVVICYVLFSFCCSKPRFCFVVFALVLFVASSVFCFVCTVIFHRLCLTWPVSALLCGLFLFIMKHCCGGFCFGLVVLVLLWRVFCFLSFFNFVIILQRVCFY